MRNIKYKIKLINFIKERRYLFLEIIFFLLLIINLFLLPQYNIILIIPNFLLFIPLFFELKRRNHFNRIFLYLFIFLLILYSISLYETIPEENRLYFAFYDLDENQTLRNINFIADFTENCGQNKYIKLDMEIFNRRDINSKIKISIPEQVKFYSITIDENFNKSGEVNITDNIVELFKDSEMKEGLHEFHSIFILKENVNPKLGITFNVFPGDKKNIIAFNGLILFNYFDYRCDNNNCINSNLEDKKIHTGKYPIKCNNLYQIFNEMGLKTSQTYLRFNSMEEEHVWMNANVIDRKMELISNIIWAIIVGLIISFFMKLFRVTNKEPD